MASYVWNVDYTETKNIYAVITNAAGSVLDFNDNTFKALGSATTPTVALTEQTGGGGSGKSNYIYSLDLSRLNKSLATVRYWITFYERAGGSAAPLTDTAINYRTPFSVQAAEFGEDELDIEFCPVYTTISGTPTMRGIVTILRNGKPIDVYALDTSATCTVTAREHGAGVDLYASSAATVTSQGDFNVSQASPGYTADRAYQHTIAATVSGTATTFKLPVANFG